MTTQNAGTGFQAVLFLHFLNNGNNDNDNIVNLYKKRKVHSFFFHQGRGTREMVS